ncbi:MAG: DUF4276 family protein [Verrucomicrobiota bacterium]
MKVKIYIEGGGDSHLQDTQFRAAWAAFFGKAGFAGRMPATFRCGGRNQAFDDFRTAVKNRRRDELPLLLVDSEDLVVAGRSPWEHLEVRDGWIRPPGAGPEDAFLMIACMETWFVADRQALQRFFGGCLRENALPRWPAPEAVEKRTIFASLDQATAGCGKKVYDKGKVSFELLNRIDPEVVARHCPGARRLLDRLRNL